MRGLPGLWRFSRAVVHGDGTVFQAIGEARFEPWSREGVAAGATPGARVGISTPLRWREKGELRQRDGEYASSFERELRLVPRGDSWWVQFADGRDFHPVQDGAFLHECGRDTYSGNLDLRADGSFQLTWTVRGPEKSYRMVTEYRRAD